MHSIFSGMVFVVPCIDTCQKVDVRLKAFNVPPLQVRWRSMTFKMSHIMRKPGLRDSVQVLHKPGCKITADGQRLVTNLGSLGVVLSVELISCTVTA